jgi:hypothetical protein
MPEQGPKEESISLEQLVVSHSYEMLALITVLEKKGILARQEIIEVIKELQNGARVDGSHPLVACCCLNISV